MSPRYGENRGEIIKHIAQDPYMSVRYVTIKTGESIEKISWGIGNSDNTDMVEKICGSDKMGQEEKKLYL